MIEAGQFFPLEGLEHDEYKALYAKLLEEAEAGGDRLILINWWRYSHLGLDENRRVKHTNSPHLYNGKRVNTEKYYGK